MELDNLRYKTWNLVDDFLRIPKWEYEWYSTKGITWDSVRFRVWDSVRFRVGDSLQFRGELIRRLKDETE
jgi:hypothetical protein